MKRILLLFAVLTLSGAAVYGQEKVRDPKEKTQYSTVFDLLRNEPGVVIAPGGGNGVMPKIYIRGISTNVDLSCFNKGRSLSDIMIRSQRIGQKKRTNTDLVENQARTTPSTMIPAKMAPSTFMS